MAPNLSPSAVGVLKASAPIVANEGTKITSRMYEIMFDEYPEVKNLFNMSHIRKVGDTLSVPIQAQALANAIFAYCSNVEKLEVLGDAIALMAHKHVSLGVLPEHYPIVGKCLLKALKDVLGEAATPEILGGWKEAYEFLADVLIGVEDKLMKEHASKEGGWFGFKKMVVTEKTKETDDITSFIIKNLNDESLPEFLAGQYLSFRIRKDEVDGYDHDIVRNYSISNKPGENFYRVSIKREVSNDLLWPDGLVSNYFHDRVNVGTTLEVGMPCGTFNLKKSESPVVFIAGGVGLTPMMSMLEQVMSDKGDSRQVIFIQCSKTDKEHPMKTRVDDLAEDKKLSSHVFYSVGRDNGKLKNTKVHIGRITKESLSAIVPDPITDNEFYFCGPPSFLGHVRKILKDSEIPDSHLNYEYFGPTQQ